MALKETGKQRAQRIPLDYYRAPDPIRRWKTVLGWTALVIPLAWLGASARDPEKHFHGSRGPVARVHQAIEQQCSACHTPFEAINSESWTVPFFTHPTDIGNQKCQTCHEGPAHHAGQKPDISCAACHREHRGEEASLTHLSDRVCTQCHKDLPPHHATGKPTLAADALSVSGFAKGSHPEFRSIQKDPGKLKFNHELHLSQGMALRRGADRGGEIQVLETIPEPYRSRYAAMQGAKSMEEPVKLQCAACHVLDGGDLSKDPLPGLPKHSDGAYFLPITYENNCQGCHTLAVAGTILADGKEDKESKVKFDKIVVPHRLQPAAVMKYLENVFLAQAARGETALMGHKLERPLPGKKLAALPDLTVREHVDRQLANVKKFMFEAENKNACMECHHIEPGKEKGMLGTIVPGVIPQVWFKGARFDHKAHRAVDCKSCHDGAATSIKSADVLIPGMDNCLQCHSPRGQDEKGAFGGVDHACTTCHNYHHRAEPFQGLGARDRAPRMLLSIQDFLSGTTR